MECYYTNYTRRKYIWLICLYRLERSYKFIIKHDIYFSGVGLGMGIDKPKVSDAVNQAAESFLQLYPHTPVLTFKWITLNSTEPGSDAASSEFQVDKPSDISISAVF